MKPAESTPSSVSAFGTVPSAASLICAPPSESSLIVLGPSVRFLTSTARIVWLAISLPVILTAA